MSENIWRPRARETTCAIPPGMHILSGGQRLVMGNGQGRSDTGGSQRPPRLPRSSGTGQFPTAWHRAGTDDSDPSPDLLRDSRSPASTVRLWHTAPLRKFLIYTAVFCTETKTQIQAHNPKFSPQFLEFMQTLRAVPLSTDSSAFCSL